MDIDAISGMNEKLFAGEWEPLGRMEDDDLTSFLDIDAHFTTEDFINQFPSDLELPPLKDEPLLGGAMLGLPLDDPHHSDSSDSGIEFARAFKMEPLSPTSSHCSELSLDSLNNQHIPLSAAFDQTHYSHILEDLAFQTDQSQAGLMQVDQSESLNAVTVLKQEIPNLANFSGSHANILSAVPNGDVSMISVDDHKPLTPPLTPNNTVTIIRASGAGNTAPITTLQNGTSLPSVVKVIMPPNSQLKNPGFVTNNSAVAKVLSHKAKVLPKPTLNAVSGTGASKTLVLTPEEFAKLTSQKLLNIKTSTTSVKPVMTTTVSHPYKPTVTVVKTQLSALSPCDVDVSENKTIKRQQRMMKNRESACLSRKRKKEYLTTLEERLQKYTDENSKLKNENHTLKKTVAFLQSENFNLKKVIPSRVMKGSTVLLGILLLMSLNLGPLMSIINAPSLPGSSPYPDNNVASSAIHHGRTLMSYSPENDQLFNVKNLQREWNMMKESSHLRREDSPPEGSKDREWFSSSTGLLLAKQIEALTGPSICPTYFNSTESQKLLNELRGWVKGHEELQKRHQEDQRKDNPGKHRPRSKKRERDPRKKYPYPSKLRGDMAGGPLQNKDYHPELRQDYGVQLFSSHERIYRNFLKTLQIRNDTFYVVSFRQDHMLLPATSHNKTMRPRMSVIMPAMGLNETMSSPEDSIAMMQIDCEVTATKLVHIQKSAVPEHLDPNVTSHQNTKMPDSYYSDTNEEFLANQHKPKSWN